MRLQLLCLVVVFVFGLPRPARPGPAVADTVLTMTGRTYLQQAGPRGEHRFFLGFQAGLGAAVPLAAPVALEPAVLYRYSEDVEGEGVGTVDGIRQIVLVMGLSLY